MTIEHKKIEIKPLTQEQQELAMLRTAISEIGGALTDLGIVLAQGIREDNMGKRNSIALGLLRAAAHVQGRKYSDDPLLAAPVVPPPASTQNSENTKPKRVAL